MRYSSRNRPLFERVLRRLASHGPHKIRTLAFVLDAPSEYVQACLWAARNDGLVLPSGRQHADWSLTTFGYRRIGATVRGVLARNQADEFQRLCSAPRCNRAPDGSKWCADHRRQQTQLTTERKRATPAGGA